MNAPAGAGAALKSVATDQTTTKATQNPAVEALNKAMAGIGQVLPKHITPERMAKLCVGMMRTNAKLAQAARRNPASFVNAIMHASKLGLEPGIDAHLVPYENRKANSVEIQCIPDYRGLLKLARNSGQITSISIQVAFTNDAFDLSLGTDDKLTHKPKLDGNRGEPMLVYAVAKFTDGSHHVEWMPVSDINKIRDGSMGYRNAIKYKSDNPWISAWDEMARKTLARRISKYLPRSIELVNAEKLMDAGDKGAPVHFDGEFAVIDEDAAQLPEHAGGEAPPAMSVRQQEGEKIDTQSSEIQQERTGDAAQAEQERAGQAPAGDGPTIEDAIAHIKRGEYPEARDIVRGTEDAETVEGMIKSHQSAQPTQKPASEGQQPTRRQRG